MFRKLIQKLVGQASAQSRDEAESSTSTSCSTNNVKQGVGASLGGISTECVSSTRFIQKTELCQHCRHNNQIVLNFRENTPYPTWENVILYENGLHFLK